MTALTVLSIDAELGSALQVGLGVGLAVLDVVGGDEVVVRRDGGGRERSRGVLVARTRDDRPARLGSGVELSMLAACDLGM